MRVERDRLVAGNGYIMNGLRLLSFRKESRIIPRLRLHFMPSGNCSPLHFRWLRRINRFQGRTESGKQQHAEQSRTTIPHAGSPEEKKEYERGRSCRQDHPLVSTVAL